MIQWVWSRAQVLEFLSSSKDAAAAAGLGLYFKDDWKRDRPLSIGVLVLLYHICL